MHKRRGQRILPDPPASRWSQLLVPRASPAASRSLPDPVELVRRLKSNQKQLEERRKDYICEFTEETRALDSKGVVKKTETKGYELFFDSGYPITRQVSKEGKPLDEHEAQKEGQRVDEEIKKDRELAEKHARAKMRILMRCESTISCTPR